MMKWKQKFKQNTLEKGEKFYLDKRVADFAVTSIGYKAVVLGTQIFEVSIKMENEEPVGMRCSCPAAKAGRSCEHMAAVLYAAEAQNMIEGVLMEHPIEPSKELPVKPEKEPESAAALMEQWLKMDAELRRQEKEKNEKAAREAEEKKRQQAAREAEERKRWQEARTEEERQKLLEEYIAAEEKRRMEKAAAAIERRTKEAKKAEKEQQAQENAANPEQEARRLAREKRKAERAQKKAEQQKKAAEAVRLEQAKRQAEEARREKIRQQKAEEAKRRAEKKQKEQEEIRRTEEKRKEEEMRRQQELKEQEEKRNAEKLCIEEELRRDEEHRLAREKRKAEFTLLGGSWEEDPDAPEAVSSESLAKLEHYSYFDGESIRNSMAVPKKVYKQAENLLAQGDITVQEINPGFDSFSGESMGHLAAIGRKNSEEFDIELVFSRKRVIECMCACPQCRGIYSWDRGRINCPYKAGTLLALQGFLDKNNFGDATDQNAEKLFFSYNKQRSNQIMSNMKTSGEMLMLVPRLVRKDGQLAVSFRVGACKLYVVKKLDVFCRNVKESATDTYGTKTKINHNIDNFSEDAKGWIQFINRVVREEEGFQQRLMESRYYYGYRQSSGVGSELNLSGWRLDEFYNQLGDESIEFEDKDSWGKKKQKQTLSCAKHNPKVTMQISEQKLAGDNEFHGIKVAGSLPDLYYGTETAYYIGQDHLNQVDNEFLHKIEPLADLAEDNKFSFHVGRNNMSEFYHRILPGLKDVVDVKETYPKKFRSYLMPEARFIFYLDAEGDNASCGVYAKYGDREVSVLDVLDEKGKEILEPFRDVAKEGEVLYQVMQMMPHIDWQKEELDCGGDEELVYQVMEHSVEKLLELGEVRCTSRFQNYHSVKSVKVSVGVSVASGLLELDISTDDIPQEELLDILNSYRAKKKYHRMKDGSFVNLDDTSVEMLAEMMDAVHMKPKEFVQGKIHLPMYRTLYLDKMLEEQDSIYSSRDSHFREIVKGFKTVKDADFEEPESLAKVLRKYQKNGYKWLRTIENWQFGGILADDMGLGKTLQVIAVLLAAKQEGKEGTSLVVTPASLIYNWDEEFRRFAAELKVTMIVGTQDERKEKLEAYEESDVLVTSYDLLKRDIVFYEGKQFLYEIIDEAQYIKNHTTAAAKAVKVVSSKIRYALTGTPIENRLSELWSIFDYLMPGFLYSYDVFKKEIETPIVKYGDEAAMKRLQKMAGPFILRRLKEDVLKDLPKKLEESRYVRFGSTQQKLYDAQVVHMKEVIARQDEQEFNKNKLQILSELTRLRQICCDPSLCFENYNGEAAKLEACLELVQSAIDGGHRMLVFSQFTSMLDILKQKLDDAKIAYYTITGSTSKEKRLQLVQEFNEGDVPVFLISLKAGGVGLNLVGADVVIHYDPWWNLAVQNQATDRAHRIGQKKKVTVYKLIAKNTIEEKIQELQETKRNLAEQVIGGESAQLGSMSREEILKLLEV